MTKSKKNTKVTGSTTTTKRASALGAKKTQKTKVAIPTAPPKREAATKSTKAPKGVTGAKEAVKRASSPAKPAPRALKEQIKKATKPSTPKRVSALDAAAQVLAKSKKPMRARELIEQMAAQGLWTSPGGKTPHATLYAAMTREINEKGKEARFKKVEKGMFAANR